MVFEFAGLECPAGADAASARRFLAELDDDRLVDRLVEFALALRSDVSRHGDAVAAMLRAPAAEVVSSPFGFRACAMAAHEGAALVQHELRALRPWHESHVGDELVLDEEHAVWAGGKLRTGKYQSFLQDDPFSAFNPEHVGKWTPHELLHRACAFAWRPAMPAWEIYLGARLNELVPVVLWYGPDQVMRLDEVAFDRRSPGPNPTSVAQALWLTRPPGELREHARRTAHLLRAGIAHFEVELDAIRSELVEARRKPVAHEFLDASSDALAYVAGHRTRLLDRATTRVFAASLRVGREVFDSVADYLEFIEGRFHALLFGTIAVDERLAAGRRDARRLRDWLQRAALAGWPAMRRLVPLLDDAGLASRRGMRGRAPDLTRWRAAIGERLDENSAAFVFADGFDRDSLAAAGFAQLHAGVEATMPALLRSLGEAGPATVREFAASDDFVTRAPLALRLACFLAGRGDFARAALARFEHEIARDRRGDDDIERLCVAEPSDDAMVVGSRAFAPVTFDVDVVPWHAALSVGELGAPQAGPVTYLIGKLGESVSVVPAPASVLELWERLKAGPISIDDAADLLAPLDELGDPSLPPDVDAWLDELLGAGVIGCIASLAD
jgi:hypothetical protein